MNQCYLGITEKRRLLARKTSATLVIKLTDIHDFENRLYTVCWLNATNCNAVR